MVAIKIGDQYIEKCGGAILTVVKVLITENANGDLLEYVVLDNNEDRAISSHKLKIAFVKVVQSETEPDPFDAVRAVYPEAKWISKDAEGGVFIYLGKPRLTKQQWKPRPIKRQWIAMHHYLSPEDFPEVYTYFADIPFDESLTEL